MVRGSSGISAVQVGNSLEQLGISRRRTGNEPGTGKSFSERGGCIHIDTPSRQSRARWIDVDDCELLVLRGRSEVAVAAGTASYVLHHCGFRNFYLPLTIPPEP